MSARMTRCVVLLLTTLVLTFAAATALATDGTVNTKSLILRKTASKSGKALQTLDKNDRVEIIEVSGDWYKVRYGKYTGYVMAKYVKVKGSLPTQKPAATPKPKATPKPAATPKPSSSSSSKKSSSSTSSSKPKMTAAPQSTKVTIRPGDVSGHVLTLQTALKSKGYYSGSLDGVYGNSTQKAVKAFQKKKGLSQDGIAGPSTLKALYNGTSGTASDSKSSTPSSKTKTESLDWFKNGNSGIPRGATFTVKDVATGKTFQVKRWAGSSHCDSEPLTSKDTATLKSIYGGSWSWNRRAILVSYNGHVYAASMNGMPHGTSTISNSFSGHFCIHFSGSKTHGSDRVDEDHQAAVKKALNSKW